MIKTKTMRLIKINISFLFFVFFITGQLARAQTVEQSLVGHWQFNDLNNLTGATIGNDLVLVGSHSAVPGPDTGNGAVNIGVGSHYAAAHGILPNGGGNRVNDFTIVMDVKIPYLGRWYVFYQTDITNSDDAEWAISPTGSIGIAATGYSESLIKPGEWYRLAISVKNGYYYNYYLDGQLLLEGNAQNIDSRFSLDALVLLLADENSEDGPVDIAEIMIFSRSLDDSEIKTLGGYGHIYEAPVDTLFHTYLQTPTPTSIYIGWHANNSEESIVEYGLTETLGSSAIGDVHVFFNQTIWHWAKLTGLTPETVYYYKVITDTVESQVKKFKTMPPDGSNNGNVRFAVIGDTQTNFTTHSLVINKLREKLIELYGENIESALNCVIHLGDMVGSGNILPSYQTEFFNPISPISGSIPYMISIGNHEVDSPNFFHYMKYEDVGGPQGEKYYSFRIGRVFFIALNTNGAYRNNTQVGWLESLLQGVRADTTIDWIFAFGHHPWRSELWVDGNTSYVEDDIIPLLKKYDVDMHMHGHTHAYQRGALPEGNLRLLQSGGGAGSTDRWGEFRNQNYPEVLKSYDHHHYVIFDINAADKKYTATAYSLGHKDRPLDNVIIDQFFRDKADISAPNTPLIVSPVPGSQIDSVSVLNSSPFSGTGELMSSHFQITAIEGDYSNPIKNEIRNYTDLYGDSGPPNWEPVDLNEGIDLTQCSIPEFMLSTQATYWWRVRYRNRNLQWSDWSEEANFITGPTIDVANNTDIIPRENILFDNYPNPFSAGGGSAFGGNPTTTIKFRLASPGIVTLNVYNISGQLVKRLLYESRSPGENKIIWNGTDEQNSYVPTGIYFIKISTKDYFAVKKALLIK